jgi:uncharacterized membrane protein
MKLKTKLFRIGGMKWIYVVHIMAGSLALLSGYVALYAAKGATLHRKSGMLFVCAMLTMSLFGMTIATVRGVAPAIIVPVGLLTAYLVITSLTTIRPPPIGARWLAIGGMLVAFGVFLTDLTFGTQGVANGGMRDGLPTFPFFIFALVALLGGVGDLRVMRSGALRGAPRIARHLWRMCFALFIAALSFFIGQAKVIPEPIRILPLLAMPVLAVLLTMFYWLWRVRFRRKLSGVAGIKVPHQLRAHA